MANTVKDLIASIQKHISFSEEEERMLYQWAISDLSIDLERIYSLCEKEISRNPELRESYYNIFEAIDFITTNDKEWDPEGEDVKDIINCIDKFTDVIKDIDIGPTDEDVIAQCIAEITNWSTSYDETTKDEKKRTISSPIRIVYIAREIGKLEILCKDDFSAKALDLWNEIFSYIDDLMDDIEIYWDENNPKVSKLVEALVLFCKELKK